MVSEKQMTKKQSSELTAPNEAWGQEGMSTSDILIPKLLLMQGLSVLVTEQKAVMGELVNSVTGEKLGGPNKVIEFAALKSYRELQILEEIDGDWKFIRSEPMTAKNENLPWEEEVNGVRTKRVKCLNFFIRLARDFGKKEEFPYLLSFRSTSYKAGRILVNEGKKLEVLGQPLASKLFDLTCKLEKNPQNKPYYVLSATPGRATTPKELNECYEWYLMIKKGLTTTDTSDELGEQTISTDQLSSDEF